MRSREAPSAPILGCERVVDGAPRVHERPALLFPLESTVVELEAQGRSERLDRASFALVPADLRHRLRAVSPVAKLVTVFVDDDAKARVVREYRPHVEAARFDTVLATLHVLPRTRWVDELAHRFLFEIDVCARHGSPAARFLETELAKELYFLGKERLEEKTRASVLHEGSDVVRRARQFIEDHLFEPFRIEELARTCHTSESTLLRAFRRELGVAPAIYVRDRRLDEALLMLESGRFAVGEVATRVGYANLPAFTVAFRRRFGVVPSHARAPSHGEPLPPHGTRPETAARKSMTPARKASGRRR